MSDRHLIEADALQMPKATSTMLTNGTWCQQLLDMLSVGLITTSALSLLEALCPVHQHATTGGNNTHVTPLRGPKHMHQILIYHPGSAVLSLSLKRVIIVMPRTDPFSIASSACQRDSLSHTRAITHNVLHNLCFICVYVYIYIYHTLHITYYTIHMACYNT